MKYQIRSNGANFHQWYRLSVDEYLPTIDLGENSLPAHIRKLSPLKQLQAALPLDTPRGRRFAAVRLARINRGQTPFELPNPIRTYRNFVELLPLIPGLLEIGTADHYSIEYRVGDLFDADEIGLAIATLLRDCFYPSDRLIAA
jgi:hypothetical protein